MSKIIAPIQIVFSNVCFEFWILLHFEYTTRAFHNCDEIIKYIRQNHDADYAKAKDHFVRLNPLIPTAKQNAIRLLKHWAFDERPYWELNPYSNAHQMIEKLDELLKV
jgi:RloB-like protein